MLRSFCVKADVDVWLLVFVDVAHHLVADFVGSGVVDDDGLLTFWQSVTRLTRVIIFLKPCRPVAVAQFVGIFVWRVWFAVWRHFADVCEKWNKILSVVVVKVIFYLNFTDLRGHLFRPISHFPWLTHGRNRTQWWHWKMGT